MKVLVNKCPYTGQLFENDNEYLAHVKTIRGQRAAATRQKNLEKRIWEEVAELKKCITNISMIGPMVFEHQAKLMEYANKLKLGKWHDDRFNADDVITAFKIETYRDFNPLVSNTHSCPKGGMTNWHCKDDLPRGYPGWRGRISGSLIRQRNNGSYPMDGIFRLLSLHTGTGGGGNANWGYDVNIYLEEWPGLEEQKQYEYQKQIDKQFEEAVARYENDKDRIIRILQRGY